MFVRNADSQGPPKVSASESLRLGPRNLCDWHTVWITYSLCDSEAYKAQKSLPSPFGAVVFNSDDCTTQGTCGDAWTLFSDHNWWSSGGYWIEWPEARMQLHMLQGIGQSPQQRILRPCWRVGQRLSSSEAVEERVPPWDVHSEVMVDGSMNSWLVIWLLKTLT